MNNIIRRKDRNDGYGNTDHTCQQTNDEGFSIKDSTDISFAGTDRTQNTNLLTSLQYTYISNNADHDR